MSSSWAAEAIERLDRDAAEVPPTPLLRLPLPADWDLRLWLKNEAAQPVGGLKYRLARALFRTAIGKGEIGQDTTVIDAAGGVMAVAEAYFARMLGLEYVAVMPARSAGDGVERWGGRCRRVEPPLAIYAEAAKLAHELGGHYLNHYSSAATVQWHGASLADELFEQLEQGRLRSPADAQGAGPRQLPEWIVTGVGTGATSAALGRFIKDRELPAKLAVVDPENSAYFPAWVTGAADYATGMPSRIEGIGRPRVEPAFDPSVIEYVIPVPDAASVAAARWLHTVTGLPVGAAAGANLWGAMQLMSRMRAAAVSGDLITLIADADDRHLATCHSDTWTDTKGLDWRPHAAHLQALLQPRRS